MLATFSGFFDAYSLATASRVGNAKIFPMTTYARRSAISTACKIRTGEANTTYAVRKTHPIHSWPAAVARVQPTRNSPQKAADVTPCSISHDLRDSRLSCDLK